MPSELRGGQHALGLEPAADRAGGVLRGVGVRVVQPGHDKGRHADPLLDLGPGASLPAASWAAESPRRLSLQMPARSSMQRYVALRRFERITYKRSMPLTASVRFP